MPLCRVSALTGCVAAQIFCNPIGLDCDTAKTEAAAQSLPLSAQQVASGARQEIRYVLFQKVSSMALFFPANHEGARRFQPPEARGCH